MLNRGITISSTLLGLGAMSMVAGCSCFSGTSSVRSSRDVHPTTVQAAEVHPAPVVAAGALEEWPPNAVPGECWAKVFVPPTVETVSERLVTREASERLEIIPARYEWVEERIMVKDASTQLAEVPAVFASQDKTIEVEPGRTAWMQQSGEYCVLPSGLVVREKYCLVTNPPVQRTVHTQRLTKAVSIQEVVVPAEYEVVRRQKLVAAASTKRIAIPAEYETVQRSVVVAQGRVEWQRMVCDDKATASTVNAVKRALLAAGFTPGPMNGEMAVADWNAVRAYQQKHGLGVGGLSYETLHKLGVATEVVQLSSR